ncbi:23S rRNA (adenine(2503)-C(2))-methyltransferase [Anoxybacter fermentans]|uniref:Probable dual-specificity RNA methyltransferase RlmN n=1 Tax=Anoxybacter fermentans TaxID=1323375 RepID=A0A3Q9HQ04_9FIRM|nr:23S rRNA (adenine(2503)-C(2))-methyltransferase RlmN [Anoxybacter fermentans]AZR72961.1 23S rRNA (adenine(2503)-C(2))-methyltransferase [Anoxybacter fermentans]
MEKIDLKSMSLDELKNFIEEEIGEKSFRAGQIFQWLHRKNVTSFNEMNNIPKDLRKKLDEKAFIQVLTPIAKKEAKDGTIKYLFRLNDNETIESVYLPYDDGRHSICISTQVGCGMGCIFCATGLGGFVRNLLPSELVDQIYAVQRDLNVKISNVVLMGMGEPLQNYDASLKAIRLLNHPKGANIGIRRITLSTCGLVPKIRRLAEEKLQLVLAISLHAPNDELRNRLMPINKKYPLKELIAACKDYTEITNRRVTFEYALMAGINDQTEHARQLVQLLKGLLCHVNLIPINPVPKTGFIRPNEEQIYRFQGILKKAGIETTIRKERGTDIDAACGQLRSRNWEARS